MFLSGAVMSKSDNIVTPEENANTCKNLKDSEQQPSCGVSENGEKKYKLGESCFTRDELVKMGCLYILILVIAFLL